MDRRSIHNISEHSESETIALHRERDPAATFYTGDVLKVLKNKLDGSKFDLIVTSPPYNIRKSYERSVNLTFDDYILWLDSVIGALVESLPEHGSICWQVGSFIKDGEIFPLDIYTYDSFKKRGMQLRNRIVWRFNFGLHSKRRFSGRYETILWFTKSDNHRFNLDPIRVPQLYPGKRHPKSKANASGLPSGNPLGKNPSDYWEFSAEKYFREDAVWDIPNVKANHPEKTIHPCQFPVELAERCILALTNPGDRVLDPFIGTGSTAIAALKHGRNAVGIDKDKTYSSIARKRARQLEQGSLKLRTPGQDTYKPRTSDKVARIPDEWKEFQRRD